jgi:hypothetical protein
MRSWSAVLLAMLSASLVAGAPPRVKIVTSDVTNFYRIYDAAGGKPSGAALQRDYIDRGSDGVRQFVPLRIVSGDELASEIAREPAVYERARTCASILPSAKRRLNQSMARLVRLYPRAKTPPVWILIGRNNSGGTTGSSGVLIGLEVVCRPDAAQTNVQDHLIHVVAHEYAHVQQPEPNGSPYVLRDSLREGVAELVAELTSGQISNPQLLKWTSGKEKQIETSFAAAVDSKDLSPWLYNGLGSPDKPGDLGYWVGYRIAKAYYLKHRRTRSALAELIESQDPHAILKASGWHPGIKLP